MNEQDWTRILGWADFEVLDNSLTIWTVAAAVFFAVLLFLLLLRGIINRKLTRLLERRENTALEIASGVVGKTGFLFLFALATYAASRPLSLPEAVETVVSSFVTIIVLVQAGAWTVSAVLTVIASKREDDLESNRGAVAAMDILAFIARVVIWTLVLMLILDNLGVNITALVAGLGVGGIAVALAAQNILGDLFASLSIVLDKPFVVGDFLIIGEFLGTVEKVGIKTTRLRSLSGEQIIFSNNDLLGSRVRNYGRMFERRVVFSLGVTYQTSASHLKNIPTMIREIVENEDNVRFDRAHFSKYGDFALLFEVVYYVKSPDYNVYMDIQQSINLNIFEAFEREGIEFAYPTQTLYVTSTGGAGRDTPASA